MNLSEIYPELKGSNGQLHLRIPQSLLDECCRLFEQQDVAYVGKVKKVRVKPDGAKDQNRFRLYLEFTRGVLQMIGGMVLNILGDDGIEIQIDQPRATPANPFIQGSLDTNFIGTNVVLKLAEVICSALGSDKVLEVELRRMHFLSYQAKLKLGPFVLLRCLIALFPSLKIPIELIDHLRSIEINATGGFLCVDLNWQLELDSLTTVR